MDNLDLRCLRYDFASSKISKGDDSALVLAHPDEPLNDHSEKVCHVFKYLIDESLIDNFYKLFLEKKMLIISREELSKVICEAVKLHDIGKLSPRFQVEKLKNESFKQLIRRYDKYTANHSFTGSLVCFKKLLDRSDLLKNRPLLLLPWLISGHHTFLRDIDGEEYFQNYGEPGVSETLDFIFEALFNSSLSDLTLFQESGDNLEKFSGEFGDSQEASLSFLYSYLYSLLVDADTIASKYSACNSKELDSILKREWKQRIDGELKKKIMDTFYREEYFNSGLKKVEKADLCSEEDIRKIRNLNELRTEMLKEASYNLIKSLETGKRIFFLNMPTGGGKTNTSMKLALDILEKTNVDRIIYAMPFINIIEQNHEVLKKNYGLEEQKEVRKIYSASESFFSGDNEEKEKMLFKDDFLDFPVMSMTFVRFFNTFIKPNKRYKYGLSSLTNSVVILDEIQSLPIKNWMSLYYLIMSAAINYNIYFIIMSATLPEFDKLNLSDGNARYDSVKLIEKPEIYFSHPLFRRTEIIGGVVEIDISGGKRDDLKKYLENLIENFNDSSKKGLIVLNTIKTSQIFFEELQKIKEDGKDLVVDLLNSSIIPLEKKKIIQRAKKDPKQNYILVSTQTIEAGVDVSFNFVVRDFATLDSIEQVRGRCNRSGEMQPSLGKVYLTRIKRNEKQDFKYIYNQEEIEIKIKETEDVLGRNTNYGYADIQNYYEQLPERINEYERDKNYNFRKGDLDNVKYWNELRYSRYRIDVIQRKANIISFFVATRINTLLEDGESHIDKSLEKMSAEEVKKINEQEIFTFSSDEIIYLKGKEREYGIRVFDENNVLGENILELYKKMKEDAVGYQKNIVQAEFSSILNKFIFQILIPKGFKEDSLKLEKIDFFFVLPEENIGDDPDKIYSLHRGFRNEKIEEIFKKYEIF